MERGLRRFLRCSCSEDHRSFASHADVNGGALAFEVFVLEGELGVEGVEVPGAVVGADGVLEGAAAVEDGGVLGELW